MKIAICSSVKKDRRTAAEYIMQYCTEQTWDCHIDEYGRGEELLSQLTQNSYHIIFLDFYSGGSGSIECARTVRGIDSNVIMIFITPDDNYFEEGYELGVKNYLEKPIEESSIRSCIRRSAKYIYELKQTLEIMTENTPITISLHDIQYIEGIKNISLIHTNQFLIKTGVTLNELEKQLENRKFLRSHQNYLVNMDSIARSDECSFYIKNGDEVPICSREKSKVLEKYLGYVSELVKR